MRHRRADVGRGIDSDVHAVGLDPSREFVDAAQRAGDGARVRFQVGDASALPFPDEEFDRVMSLLVLNFVPGASAAVLEMTRVTRPDGIVAAAVWDYGDGMEMLRLFWEEAVALDQAAAERDERRMPLSRPGELSALWRGVGLRDVEEAPLTIDLAFASFDDFWQPFLCGQGPAGVYVTTLTESGRAQLRTRLRARLARAESGFTLTARAWAVRGVAT